MAEIVSKIIYECYSFSKIVLNSRCLPSIWKFYWVFENSTLSVINDQFGVPRIYSLPKTSLFYYDFISLKLMNSLCKQSTIRILPTFYMWFQTISFKNIAGILVGAKSGFTCWWKKVTNTPSIFDCVQL